MPLTIDLMVGRATRTCDPLIKNAFKDTETSWPKQRVSLETNITEELALPGMNELALPQTSH